MANFSVLYVKLHNYHWYITGGDFFELHEKFEEFYTESASYIDEIAERMLALDGKPVATMRDCLQTSSITEASGKESALQMVESISSDFNTIIEELKQGIEAANNNQDDPTADLLIGIRTSLEKHNWMLKSFLA